MLDVACVPVLTGHKTTRERFAGATRTWTCEGMMGDGKSLQMGTSHELGQNFAKAFGIQFSDAQGTQQYAWQTSWGASTRLIGRSSWRTGTTSACACPRPSPRSRWSS